MDSEIVCNCFGDTLFVYNFKCNFFAIYWFYCATLLQLICLCSDVSHYFLQGVMLIAASLNRALVDFNDITDHQNQE